MCFVKMAFRFSKTNLGTSTNTNPKKTHRHFQPSASSKLIFKNEQSFKDTISTTRALTIFTPCSPGRVGATWEGVSSAWSPGRAGATASPLCLVVCLGVRAQRALARVLARLCARVLAHSLARLLARWLARSLAHPPPRVSEGI